MIKMVQLVVAGVLVITGSAMAGNLGSGSLTYAGGGIIATEQWGPDLDTDDFGIAWDINQVGLEVTYTYTLHVPSKELSHWILELSPNFAARNILDTPTGPFGSTELRTDTTDPTRWGPDYPGNAGNPGLTVDFPGIKFDDASGTGDLVFVIKTDRLPKDGSFYAKDGKNNQNDLYAYNTGLTDSEGAFIKVPDTCSVPEPTAGLLVGLGLAGAGMLLRRRR